MLEAGEAAAFHGVGRLNIAGSRFCTATLIAPDVIATAAHCLFHPLTGARVADGELRFVAGYRMRRARRRCAGWPRRSVDPGYAFGARATYAGVGADLALGRARPPGARGGRALRHRRPRRRAAALHRLLRRGSPARALDRDALRDRPARRPGARARLRRHLRRLGLAAVPGRGRGPAPRRGGVGDGRPHPSPGRRDLRAPARRRPRAAARRPRRGARRSPSEIRPLPRP